MTLEVIAGLLGSWLIFAILLDAFETVVLPRRVTGSFRPTYLFYKYTWRPWAALANRISSRKRRESYLSFYGPLSLLFLLSLWAVCLIIGFALLQFAAGSAVAAQARERVTLSTLIYMSGSTFFTLGFGDVTPSSLPARFLAISEAGVGFGFLGIVIGYLPVLYSAFSVREVNITLLDSRAGSPPSATELLVRLGTRREQATIDEFFKEWERWAAELLQSHLSYPVLSFFRSQHDNESWLAALTTVLDTSALVVTGLEDIADRQAKLTFAMARHAVVDLAQVLGFPPVPPESDRLPEEELKRMQTILSSKGFKIRDTPEATAKLQQMRAMYEPLVNGLSQHLHMPLPKWVNAKKGADNWRTSAWEKISMAEEEREPSAVVKDEHF